MDDRKIAGEIYKLVGGRENVANVSNCMTRLRLTLHDMGTAQLADIKEVDGVLGVNCMENELQIIFGPSRVNKIADAFKEIMANAKNQKPRIGDGKKLHQEIRARNDTPI
ncbi:MAG: PTS glucose/sucrose transporter subunit IIB, partial [Selenomonadaceae bacterium]|nr:PTS glucose/sucrose transporter subunit IIB [Selenomonadaceae bacterium]